MRRIAMTLGMVGLIGLGVAVTPAQAHEGWWGDPGWRDHSWREQQWRERDWAWRHHEWREHRHWRPWFHFGSYAAPDYAAPGVTVGFSFR